MMDDFAVFKSQCEQIELLTQQNVELLQRVSNECLVSKFFDKNDGQDSAADVAN